MLKVSAEEDAPQRFDPDKQRSRVFSGIVGLTVVLLLVLVVANLVGVVLILRNESHV